MNHEKTIIVLLVIVVGLVIFASATKSDKKIASTDLGVITIEGLQIGDEVKQDFLDRYIDASDKYSDEFKYMFDEILIDVDYNGKISFIKGIEGKAKIYVKGEAVTYIEDVKRMLGSEYIDKTYDRGQPLYEYVYKDNEKKQVAQFVYAPNGEISWVTVSDEAYYLEKK